MARTTLSITPIVNSGVAFVGAAPDATNGNALPNNGRQMLVYKNADSGSHTVTIKAYPNGGAPDGLTVSDKVVTIAAGATEIIGPFPPSIYNDAANNVYLDYSSAVSQTQQAFTFSANPG